MYTHKHSAGVRLSMIILTREFLIGVFVTEKNYLKLFAVNIHPNFNINKPKNTRQTSKQIQLLDGTIMSSSFIKVLILVVVDLINFHRTV